jgi:GrpB-like predicted nucleotidyltransferase (UPF0157 family)
VRVVVVAHDPKWIGKFHSEATIIGEALGSVAVGIHHIGSTAVPGIAAKPIIDILVEARSVVAIDENATSLEACGYESMGEFGIPGRRYFRKDNAAGVREYQIHAFAADSREVARHLSFRDLIFPREHGHRVKDLIMIRNEVLDEQGKKEIQRGIQTRSGGLGFGAWL